MRTPITHDEQTILEIFDGLSKEDKATLLTFVQLMTKVDGTEDANRIYRVMTTVIGSRRHGLNALGLINSALGGNQTAWAMIDASIEASA